MTRDAEILAAIDRVTEALNDLRRVVAGDSPTLDTTLPVEKLLTVEEARERIRVSGSTITRHLKTGDLYSIKIGGRRLIPESAVTDFIRVQTSRTEGGR